jgi:arginase family enzyme
MGKRSRGVTASPLGLRQAMPASRGLAIPWRLPRGLRTRAYLAHVRVREGDREAATQPALARDPARMGPEGVLARSCTLRRAVETVGAGPVFVTVDVDVLDPAFAPGTGTPEPGGMTTVDLLWVPNAALELEVVGADVVEVIPTAAGSADTTPLTAERIVREILTGLAVRRRRRR